MLLMMMDWKNLYECASLVGEVKPNSRDDNPFRYCGEYYDKEREEDETESLHLYTYCENDGA